MRKTLSLVLLLCTISAVPLGCSNSGIRRLENVELQYYTALSKDLKTTSDKLQVVLNASGDVASDARYTVARLDDSIDRAKAVYSVREVLTAPKGDRHPFIQDTRNTLIMYVLAEGSRSSAKALEAQAAADKARRQEMIDETRRLATLAGALVESEKQLHAYLNQTPTTSLRDVLNEVGRQIDAFDAEAKKADQSNAAVAQALREGGKASGVVHNASSDLEKFIGVWNSLNQTK